MKNIFALILLVFIGSLKGTAQPLTEIRIISEDKSSLILEFIPQIQTQQILGSNGTVFTRFSFFESQVAFDSSDNADFFRAVLLLLPSDKYSLQVIASDFQVKDSIRIIPKPKIKFLKDFGAIEIYDEEISANGRDAIEQKPLAELTRVGKTGIGYEGVLVLHPVQDIGQLQVKVFTRIRVRIDFKDSFEEGELSTNYLRGNFPTHKQLKGRATKSFEKTSVQVSPLMQGKWYRIEVQETGMYKLDYNYFQQLDPTYTDIAKCRIYGNGGLAIPDNKTYTNPDSLVEISRMVVKNSSGNSNEDYIIFYGRSVRGWRYVGGNNFQHYINPYTEINYYFFTFDTTDRIYGKPMGTLSATDGPSPVYQPTSFTEKIFVEKEQYNLLNSGKRWVGKLFTGIDNSDTYRNSLPGLVPSLTISYSLNFLRRSSTYDVLNVYENGTCFSGDVTMGYTYVDSDEYAKEFRFNGVWNGGISGDASIVKIQVKSSNQDSKTWLDWLEIYYQRKFEALDDALLFTSQDRSGTIQYAIKGFSSTEVFAFDVTNHANVKQLELDSNDPSVRKFNLQQTGGSVREIALVAKNKLKIPSLAIKIENSSLRNPFNQAEFVIISPKEFWSAANKLKDHRDALALARADPLITEIVDINHIYNEFSGGIPDPLAIREFLNYAQSRWQLKPRYALLFGWGHFDYKNILKTNLPNWIPTYESEESFNKISTYNTDDILGIFSANYAIAIGRIPARTYNEAVVVVNKIISYETKSVVDPWRNRITFIADDGKTSEGDDGTIYTSDTEGIAENVFLTPPSFEKKKIYIVAYPTVNSSSGRRKPDANRAIVDAINQGSLVTNFVGHGNERLWTHEAIFTREDNLPQLSNRDRLTFIVAATCSYGRFDDPKESSAAELLLTMEQGGAIATVAASRVVYQTDNMDLNRALFGRLLFKDTNGIHPRLGDVWRITKNTVGEGLFFNKRKFHLFGDPTIRLLIPQEEALIDSVNGIPLTESNIQIKSLENVRIAGTVKQKDTTLAPFNGYGTLQLFDSKKEINIKEGNYTFKFNVDGSSLFRGDVKIDSGKYKAVIPIPKDVTFGKSARLAMYAWNDHTDGVGYTEKVMIDGVDTTVRKEYDGPNISLYLDDYDFHSGDVVKGSPTLIVRLEDKSGINTSTVGVGHQLLAKINNSERTYDLSSSYRSDQDTYQSGEARYLLRDLSDGKYTLSVIAWDIQNNSSEAEISFEVCTGDDLTMLNVFNYPNPFSNSTTFTFQRNSVDPIDVEVKIYSVSGRLINKFNVNASGRSVRIHWDGKDNEGATLANGIYFYKLIIQNQINRQSRETIGKLAVIR